MTDPVQVEGMFAHCAAKPGAWADNPWEHDHPVFKVGPGERGKIFAFLGATGVGVKGGPDREVADEWLDRAEGSARRLAAPAQRAAVLVARGDLRRACGELDAAADAYRAAAESLQDLHF